MENAFKWGTNFLSYHSQFIFFVRKFISIMLPNFSFDREFWVIFFTCFEDFFVSYDFIRISKTFMRVSNIFIRVSKIFDMNFEDLYTNFQHFYTSLENVIRVSNILYEFQTFSNEFIFYSIFPQKTITYSIQFISRVSQ